MNKIDPSGLYQEDMHYYMVFFLALASGMDYTTAKITALASQYVDNNPITRPVDDETMAKLLESPLKNQQQLKWYHFTLSDDNGHTIKKFDNSDVGIVNSNLSPQLKNLSNAVSIGNPSQPCAKYQFLGEFLHSYADTFSHRDGMNRPIDALTMGLGVGHGLSGEQPDYTYNGDPNYTGTDPIVIAKVWNVREERSFAAERAILGKLKDFSTSSAVSPDEIDVILKTFNAIREHGEDSPYKKKLLQETLNNWIGEKKLNLTNADGTRVEKIELVATDTSIAKDAYILKDAKKNRDQFLGDLKGQEDKYPGVCLPGSTVCKEVKL
ncbi:DUF6765 family protein [Undibacterium sp. SXout11W]|uniref:DUF6765 family protein n=1 Tax=Undibacterium sp. SXout11W TaxID=3413050 RepID=UPI003BEFCD2E